MQAFVFVDVNEDVLFLFPENEHFVSKIVDFSSQLIVIAHFDLNTMAQQIDSPHFLGFLLHIHLL